MATVIIGSMSVLNGPSNYSVVPVNRVMGDGVQTVGCSEAV